MFQGILKFIKKIAPMVTEEVSQKIHHAEERGLRIASLHNYACAKPG